MSTTTLTLTVEPGVFDARSSWSEFESLAVQMSREVPLRALEATLADVQERLIDSVRATVAAGAEPAGIVRAPALRGGGGLRAQGPPGPGDASCAPRRAPWSWCAGTWAAGAAGGCSHRCFRCWVCRTSGAPTGSPWTWPICPRRSASPALGRSRPSWPGPAPPAGRRTTRWPTWPRC